MVWSGLLWRTGARLAPAITDCHDCFARTGWAVTRTVNSVSCAISTVEKASGLEVAGSPANWRCIVLEKLRRVNILLANDGWHTAPNHSHPASCVVKADIDTEDYPEHDPQKGHCGSCPSSSRARIALSVAIDVGLCRSGRVRRAARPEVRRRFVADESEFSGAG
jgi:hypothetical protein